MANDLNQCNFIGRLGADPETRYSGNGDAITNFRIACGWKTKDKEGAEWVPVVAFGKLGEICGEYLRKGSQVFISGNFRTRKWQDQSGQDRYSTEIIASTMQMLGSKPEGSSPSRQQASPQRQQPASEPAGNFDDFDDELPPF